MTATISWFRAATWGGAMDNEKRTRIFDDLEKYCELDTLAMVEIFNHLTAISNGYDDGSKSAGART
jgi:hypothetical protein